MSAYRAKIQALVYAQALRSQLPGYSCAAALLPRLSRPIDS